MTSLNNSLFAVLCAVLFSSSMCEIVSAETFYFMTVYGSQCEPPRGDRVHSFATFVKATGCGNDWSQYQLEVHTISWLPVTKEIKIWRLVPEEGDNFGLHETIRWALKGGANVQKWGPYQISCETFQRAVHRIGLLDADLIAYQAVDPVLRIEISNCIHAVSGVDPYDPRTRYPLIRVGYSASEHIAEVFLENDLILDAEVRHLWLDKRLGLCRYPIETSSLKAPLFSAGVGVTPRRENRSELDHVRVRSCPDFIVPPGCRR